MLVKTKAQLLEFYRKMNLAYGSVFPQKSPAVEDVLADLAKFCRAGESTFHPDPRVHALLEGRREVYLRIQDFLSLNHEELVAKHAKGVDNPSTP